jgi:hypothetical protein
MESSALNAVRSFPITISELFKTGLLVIALPLMVAYSNLASCSFNLAKSSIVEKLSIKTTQSLPSLSNNFLSLIQMWYIVGGGLLPLHKFTYLLFIISIVCLD